MVFLSSFEVTNNEPFQDQYLPVGNYVDNSGFARYPYSGKLCWRDSGRTWGDASSRRIVITDNQSFCPLSAVWKGGISTVDKHVENCYGNQKNNYREVKNNL